MQLILFLSLLTPMHAFIASAQTITFIHIHIYSRTYCFFFSWFMSIPQSNVLSMSLNMGDDFLKSKSLPREYAELTVPNYGVEVPQGMDFSKYNQKRVCKSEHVSV